MDNLVDVLKGNIQRAQEVLEAATEWTPKLQMVAEQKYICQCLLEAIENDRVVGKKECTETDTATKPED